MNKKIICRFRNEKDLQEFAEMNNISINKNTKEYFVYEGISKEKKNGVKRGHNESWKRHWKNMPEYISSEVEAYATITFNFDFEMDDEAKLEIANMFFGQLVTHKTKSLWYPRLIQGANAKLRVVGGTSETKYPIYVVSKNRPDHCTTSKYLCQMKVPHFVVVEPSDFAIYQERVANEFATIIEMDMMLKQEYDTFDDLGDTKGKGPGAARNFAWFHSIQNGHAWHWVMDDNANEGFHIFNDNKKRKCRTGAMFRACEDFVDRYDNIAIAGLNYTKFCQENSYHPAYVMNTRIYSFLLIRNDIPYYWRGRYNEDTDLSLRVLKDGWCTVQFNAFLAGKATTQKIKGGNTEEFYAKEGTLPKSQMLADMHPDVAKVTFKFSRWHHEVDYSGYKQELRFKDSHKEIDGVNNYGMVTINTDEEETSCTKDYLENKYAHLIPNAKYTEVK